MKLNSKRRPSDGECNRRRLQMCRGGGKYLPSIGRRVAASIAASQPGTPILQVPKTKHSDPNVVTKLRLEEISFVRENMYQQQLWENKLKAETCVNDNPSRSRPKTRQQRENEKKKKSKKIKAQKKTSSADLGSYVSTPSTLARMFDELDQNTDEGTAIEYFHPFCRRNSSVSSSLAEDDESASLKTTPPEQQVDAALPADGDGGDGE
mmetsp:Transcript_1074/g.1551  ORF Transcript_1074/g.1551 Transcript_1074/m.1551 type:complete len:208 (+) Transcript_1074:40-663(+)